MVATQLLISVCVASLAAAAPQQPPLAAGDAEAAGLVTNVVSALQPSIAAAVAEALRGFAKSSSSGSSSSSSVSSSTAVGSSGNVANLLQQQGVAAVNGEKTVQGVSGAATVGGGGGLNGGSASPVDAATGRAVYAYQYQIADDLEQTYITQNEQRDGDAVTGAYSYVDPNGDLITVNYQAGPAGYTQTVDRQVAEVEIRARPAKTTTQSAAQEGVRATVQRPASAATITADRSAATTSQSASSTAQ